MKQEAFFELAAKLTQGLRVSEVLFCNLDGEDSSFVRLNQSRIRQAGSLYRRSLDLNLIDGRRQVTGCCELAGAPDKDLALGEALLKRLRERIAHVPEDPYLDYSMDPGSSERNLCGDLPDAGQAVTDLIAGSRDLDLVGIWASGSIVSALGSSLGHRHWHQSTSFNLDWSCYLDKDKAVKSGFGGFDWDNDRLKQKLDEVRWRLEVMARPARSIPPGRYPAYLSPEAVQEVMELLAWGGFDLKSHRTAQTPLMRLAEGERSLDRRITICEEHARGLAPGFTPEGFIKPERVDLIRDGAYRECLVDSRTGKEYGAAVNAGVEYPQALALDAGDIPRSGILERLGTGLYIGNLWYLNYADRNDCRVTGMTRFGTFWVENAELVAPVNVMRFDDSLYHLLGDRLDGLTRERELILSASTYEGRSSASSLLPGMLVAGIELTL